MLIIGFFASLFIIVVLFNMVCGWLGLGLYVHDQRKANRRAHPYERSQPGIRPAQAEWDRRKAAGLDPRTGL